MTSHYHPAGITTLRRLQTIAGPPQDSELCRLATIRPVTLVLPCHARDLGTESLALMVQELAATPWISRFIIGLDGLEESGLPAAKACFAALGERVSFLWTGSPASCAVEARLKAAHETTASSGKGRNVWLCFGLALALSQAQAGTEAPSASGSHSGSDGPSPSNHESSPDSGFRTGIVAVHDCDIQAYPRELPARLCLPLLRPEFGFRFSKGFYARHSDRLHGRLMRLLVHPLLQAMEMLAGPVPVLQFIRAFQYPLAGETAMDMNLLRHLAIPAGWGLEMGLLHQIHRLVPPSAVCQAGLCAVYDHKHQDLCPDDPGSGLHRMAREVSATLLGTVSGGTYPWREGVLKTWEPRAAEALRQAEAEALINGLSFDRGQEALAIRTFGQALENALEWPAAPALLPSWASAERLCPGIVSQLAAAESKL
ncbi:MAG: hypothetical protein JWM59_127 [Verrucomicrobiales bacterium]|nr:hypothetical protein [Verrucomicrobiales bacterium]